MLGYFSIGFTDFILGGKKLTDFTNDFKKYNDITLSYFKNK